MQGTENRIYSSGNLHFERFPRWRHRERKDLINLNTMQMNERRFSVLLKIILIHNLLLLPTPIPQKLPWSRLPTLCPSPHPFLEITYYMPTELQKITKLKKTYKLFIRYDRDPMRAILELGGVNSDFATFFF